MESYEIKNFCLAGIDIACLTYQETLKRFEEDIKNNKKYYCVTINLDILRLACQNDSYHGIIKKAGLVIADGMPLIWLSRLFGQNILPERIPGCEIVVDLFELSDKKGYKIFILGAAPGVADKAKGKLEKKLKNVKITGTYSPDKNELEDEEKSDKIVELINDSEAQILFIALGAPKQENWISKHIHKLNINIAVPCGASIDFIVGQQIRAPLWLCNIGFEWVWRLFCDPKRMFDRYIMNDIPFLFNLIIAMTKEKNVNVTNVLENILTGVNFIKDKEAADEKKEITNRLK